MATTAIMQSNSRLHFGGVDVMGTLDKWGHRIKHVHFKDVRDQVTRTLRAEIRSFLDGVIAGAFSVPGDPEGCIDCQAVTDALKKMDCAGWIIVEAEQDPACAPPYEYSKLGYDHIVRICKQSGLAIEEGN